MKGRTLPLGDGGSSARQANQTPEAVSASTTIGRILRVPIRMTVPLLQGNFDDQVFNRSTADRDEDIP
jgi:hypothetical protein